MSHEDRRLLAEHTSAGISYQAGFANQFATEAVAGALPAVQNSPQQPPLGLVSELVSGTAFAAPRASNRRSYLFRVRPSTHNAAWEEVSLPRFLTPPLDFGHYPGPLRWSPMRDDAVSGDFLNGIETISGNGSPMTQSGMAIHIYNAAAAMAGKAFANNDAEMLLIPQTGTLLLRTELGVLQVSPGEFAVLPKGIKLRVDPLTGPAYGFLCENFGLPFELPELGLIGSHGLANAIDFQAPVAAFDDIDQPVELIQKSCGRFWANRLDHGVFDVVAWRGNWAPCKFDMMKFNTVGSISYDHPDPSIFCALTSPSSAVAGGNVDFMILPPRWLVAEHSFRPPGFHRNAVAEFLALVQGSHDSRNTAFPPGSFSLHNCWTPHGPDTRTLELAREAELLPQKVEDTMVFMLETRFPLEMASGAMAAPQRQTNCADGWAGFTSRFPNAG